MTDVIITNKDHPHYGETGKIKTVDGKVTIKNVLGKEMFEIELFACRHGVGGCFVSKNDIKLFPDNCM